MASKKFIIYIYICMYKLYSLPISLIDEMSSSEQIGLEVSVQHVLHHGVDGLLVGAHSQQPHDVLHKNDEFVKESRKKVLFLVHLPPSSSVATFF